MTRSRPAFGPRVTFIALILAGGVPAIGHGDWPHLRGPNFDGVSTETGLADSWPAGGPPLLWSRDLGQGYSGFVVADGRLYTQRQTVGGQSLLCLDPDNGDLLWEHRYDWAWQTKGAYPGPYATPTVAGGRVFFASPTGLVGCVDARTGAPLWSVNVREKFQGKGCEFGYAATPLVEDDKVILPVGGPSASLVALHVDDGRTVWATGSDPASYCPAFPITFQGRRCVVGYLQNAVLIADLATGKVRHRQPLSAGYDEHSAWPLYAEPHLLLTAPFRVPAARLELQAGDGDAILCRTRWTSKEFCNDVASSVLVGGHVYGFDLKQLQSSKHRPSRGSFRCLDWKTGKTCWSRDAVGHAAVLAADGKLFLLNDTGELILARADPAEYRELGRVALFEDEACWTPPSLWRGRLYVRSPSRMVCLHVGRHENAAPTSAALRAGRSWRFDAGWLLNRERDYPNDAPTWDEMTLWFTTCVLFGFAAVPFVCAARYCCQWLPPTPVYWGAVFVLGALGPNLFSAVADRCLFTWPVALYAAFHGALLACWWAERQPSPRRARWMARLAVVGLLLVGYGYFEACRAVGMFVGWTFLVGFPAAFPLTALATRAEARGQSSWVAAAWTLPAFAAYFWSSQLLFLWQASRGE